MKLRAGCPVVVLPSLYLRRLQSRWGAAPVRQRGSKATAQVIGHTVASPRPWLFGAARTPDLARINISGVLGSLPWLFENLMASQGQDRQQGNQ